jgi:hypothetical protein
MLATCSEDAAPSAASFGDLPDEVLALVASVGLTEAHDAASFAAASKRCTAVCRAAPLRLAVAVAPGASPQDEQAAARATLQQLCASFPGTAELDLRGSPLEDGDVAHALRTLPALSVLQLSGCKKLTPTLTADLLFARAPGTSGAGQGGLRCVTLQRCFQLTAAALSDVLAAAARPGSRLAAAALSHLSLASWPAVGQAPPPPGQLRVLALHNCDKLGPRALEALSQACPRLEVLMLGGSVLLPEQPAAAADEAADGGGDSGSDAVDSANNCPAADGLPQRFFDAVLAVLQGEDAAPALCSGFAAHVAGVAAQLAALVARLPHLQVLELTFGLPGLAAALQHLAATEPELLAGRAQAVAVWDLCTATSVADALAWRRAVRARWCAAGGRGAVAPSDAAALLHAAVNCSSGGRQTPLHAAADDCDTTQLQALLELGAQVDARDRSGATALFAACEAGRTRAVECLLAAGASATQRNSAGEAPLYIAALKGWERIVDLLLAHFKQRGVSWQAQRLYDGDGWTPLMAAAVGGRTAIVLKLLAAAGQEAAQLVGCVNRYGQSAVHIAARKGSPALLRSLVDAGGASALLTADCEGKTAAEIARRNGNGSAMHVLLREQQQLARDKQRGSVPTVERPRPNNDHRHQQHPPQRWVGRRLQQRKGSNSGSSGSAGH